MKTNLVDDFLKTSDGENANRILRSCVHCGFCNATCPTYQVLGDELDGPRGRIYLIKQTLEGKTPGRQTQLHLDRCLTCRNCESTCPSGVDYGQLLNIGREVINQQVRRPPWQRLQHFALRKFFLSRFAFSTLLKTGQLFRPLLPASVTRNIPQPQKKPSFQKRLHDNKVLLISGCVQPALKPNIDSAARIVFDRLSIESIEPENTRCCGSLSHHLNARDEALDIIRDNIDNWLTLIEQHQIENICMTASGCGVAIKEYAQLLAADPAYAAKAARISAMYQDPAQIIAAQIADRPEVISQLTNKRLRTDRSIAFHPPCTLQHGQQQKNLIEPILKQCGFRLRPFADSHLCCGSAGTYSITHKAISRQLLSNKLNKIKKSQPDIIVTANIGCQLHLQSGTDTPVKHWLELLI